MIFLDILETFEKVQNSLIEEGESKQPDSAKEACHFDKLRMYFGEDYEVNGITISMPTIGDILNTGEEKFYNAVFPFLCNSTSIRVMLWEKGVDWTTVKDIEVFFIMLNMAKDTEPLNLLFKNIHFDNIKIAPIKGSTDSDEKLVLYDLSQNLFIDEEDYMKIAEYIREILAVHPKTEKAKGRATKLSMIQEDRINALHTKSKESTSSLLSLISACVNHPGFKYKLQELKDVGIYQFMDSVRRIQKYETSVAAIGGCYSGFVDTKKLDKELFNFMGDV